MSSIDPEVQDRTKLLDTEIESALNPIEVDGFYRDTRECAALALLGGGGKLLLAPPTPRPKKG
ncbi:hypothetical protein NX801_22715 [Streptomyces sp. LP05-1]|uniref:Uncharacterized protein n=1 Tax=Streptomyces pyxinae TaxID=2970734 RepID=A0ABT2CM63_9ACTN|nr:hypothetical protein [Streptomyces sp. LP05-1]MCS0638415.1 hypothetical protein [Streptomyces sp. LP05-1]